HGFADGADVRAEDVGQRGGRMRFTLCLPDGSRTPATLALPGRHNVLNALAAASIGWQLGVAPAAIATAFEKFEGIGRRFNLLAELSTADRKSTRLNSSHVKISYAVFCLKKKTGNPR